MPNPFVHVELSTTNLRKAKAFYGEMFNWKLSDVPMPDGNYTTVGVGKGTGGGMLKQTVAGAPSAWLAYVEVQDIDATTKKAKKLRAKIITDVTDVMGMGWLSVIVDPTGGKIGLWEAKKKVTAKQRRRKIGKPPGAAKRKGK
jgi:predicted enzyme related to lactoylglutathione lyase